MMIFIFFLFHVFLVKSQPPPFLVSASFLKVVFIDREAYCQLHQCKTTPVYTMYRYTMHGVWPQDHQDYGIDCESQASLSGVQITPVPVPLPDQALEITMRNYWPSYTGADEDLWEHEFSKHGSCSPLFQNNPVAYFQYSLYIAAQTVYANLRTPDILDYLYRTCKIYPGYIYQVQDVIKAIKLNSNQQKYPQLRCRLGGAYQDQVLIEIAFCTSPVGNPIIVDCMKPEGSCTYRNDVLVVA